MASCHMVKYQRFVYLQLFWLSISLYYLLHSKQPALSKTHVQFMQNALN